MKKLPEFIADSFVAAQRVSIKQKRIACENIIFQYVDYARCGFWDKVPIINVFTTDDKILKMFKKISDLYNTNIPEFELKNLFTSLGHLDIENGFHGLINPFRKKYDSKLDRFFDEIQRKDGFNVQINKLDKKERAARLLAYYGYTFLNSVEKTWEELTEEQLKDIEVVIKHLTANLNKTFRNK
jgi:predicted methyltransferase